MAKNLTKKSTLIDESLFHQLTFKQKLKKYWGQHTLWVLVQTKNHSSIRACLLKYPFILKKAAKKKSCEKWLVLMRQQWQALRVKKWLFGAKFHFLEYIPHLATRILGAGRAGNGIHLMMWASVNYGISKVLPAVVLRVLSFKHVSVILTSTKK